MRGWPRYQRRGAVKAMSLLIVIPGVISVLALLSAFLFNRSVVKQAKPRELLG